jgi:hypothetical protein
MVDKDRDPRRLRNLVQYRDLTDEQFDKAMEALERDWLDTETQHQLDTFDDRVAETMKQFEEDYDLSDMKFNDRATLEALSRAYVTLQDFDTLLTRLRASNLKEESYVLTVIDKLSKIASDYRRDISRMEDDLKISRKIRKSTGEESARQELQRLKEKALKFKKQVMSYIYCPKCTMLLATVWTLYPEEDNEFHFKCKRPLDETGKNFCNHEFVITTSELLEAEGTNHPEGLKF